MENHHFQNGLPGRVPIKSTTAWFHHNLLPTVSTQKAPLISKDQEGTARLTPRDANETPATERG